MQPADISLPQNCVDSTVALTPNSWHHITGVNSGDTLSLYINAQPAGELAFDARTGISQSGYSLFLGTDLYNAPGRLHPRYYG